MFNGQPENEIPEINLYCPKCGGSGITPKGDVCTCRNAQHAFGEGVCSLDIPRQYSGKTFNPRLVPGDCGPAYQTFLSHIHNDTIALKILNYNCLICSPISHAKTVCAYSALEALFRKNIPTFPVCNIMEIRHILRDFDNGVTGDYQFETPASNLMTAPYIFIKIPIILTWEVYPTIADILDRRVRRGLSTFFLYDGYIDEIKKYDKNKIVESLTGNGSYFTIDIHNFYRINKESDEITKFNDILGPHQLF